MALEPDNLVLAMLREIRAKQDDHSARFSDIENQIADIKKQAEDQAEVIVHVLGQSSETRFRQSKQEKRINELFEKVERLLLEKQPS
jgi:hypothetical protein